MKRQLVLYLQEHYPLSERRSCALSGISRRTYHYKSIKPPDVDLIDKLTKLAKDHRGYGFWKLYYKLRSSGYPKRTSFYYYVNAVNRFVFL